MRGFIEDAKRRETEEQLRDIQVTVKKLSDDVRELSKRVGVPRP
jgi:hypothetical protein